MFRYDLDLGADLVMLMGCADLASRRWIWEQYDHMVMADTVHRPGGDAAVVRLHGSNRGLAITTDCTPRYVKADPFEGGKQAVAEAWRNITAVAAGGNKAGARIFPSHVPNLPDQPEVVEKRAAWKVFEQFTKPWLCAFSDRDPVTAGGERPFLRRIPATNGQPHTTIQGAGHFLQQTIALHLRSFWLQLGQCFQRFQRFTLGALLQHLAQQHQRDHRGAGFKIDVAATAEANHGAVDVSHRSAQRHQHIHIGCTISNGFVAMHKIRLGGVKHDRCRQHQQQPAKIAMKFMPVMLGDMQPANQQPPCPHPL